MATAARNIVPIKQGRVRKDGQPDGRHKNPGGKRIGAGRPQWQPECKRKETQNPGVFRDETQEEAWERTRMEVRHYVAIGFPNEVICRMMQPMIGEDLLRKHFQWELDNGRFYNDAKVAGTGYWMATSGRFPDMTRFWLRARMGWRDHGDIHAPTAPIQFQLIEGDDW